MKTWPLALIAFALLLTGCWQKSLHPFYLEKDLITDDKILGEWLEVENDPAEVGKWTFTKAESPNTYKLQIKDKEVTLDLDARLFKLGEHRFFDFYSRNRNITEIPAHHLFRVTEIGDSLKLQIMSMDFVRKWVEAHPNDLAHIRTHDPEKPTEADAYEIILTDDTARLQKFVREHVNDEGFFDSLNEFKRAK